MAVGLESGATGSLKVRLGSAPAWLNFQKKKKTLLSDDESSHQPWSKAVLCHMAVVQIVFMKTLRKFLC
jgi:hypothetical protein